MKLKRISPRTHENAIITTIFDMVVLISAAITVLCTTVVLYAILELVIQIFRRFLALPKSESNGYDHVLITGGSSGIGLELAKLYLKDGKKVTIVARNMQKLEEAVKECKDELKLSEDRIFALSCDTASSQNEVGNKINDAVRKFGPVDILVNCAGVSFAGEFESISQQEFEKLLKINVLGSVYPTQAIVPSMKERRKGKIVFVSSQVGQVIN